MNINKEYLKVNCTTKLCPHRKTCCKLPTEVVRHKEKGQAISIIVVGQGGGVDEERQKVPFIGVSGQYLRALISHMWKTNLFNLALSNTVRCRPCVEVDSPGKNKKIVDREPTKEELSFCLPYLWNDIDLLKPKTIITVGKSATKSLAKIGSSSTMTSLRGKTFESRGYNILPTWHPAYLTRNYGQFNSEELQKEDIEIIQDITTALTLPLPNMQLTMDF
jgi:DNA polymerase